MIEVEVEDPAWGAVDGVEALVARAAEHALEAVGASSGAGARTGVTILLADDEVVGELNARFRGKDKPTNVLSFPAPPNAAPHLGDIALAYGVCAAEAREQGKTLADHLRHLVVHGVLHLLGRDHEDDAQAEAMEAEERAILARLGVAAPYRNDLADVGS